MPKRARRACFDLHLAKFSLLLPAEQGTGPTIGDAETALFIWRLFSLERADLDTTGSVWLG